MIVKFGHQKDKLQKAGLYTLPIALKYQAGKMYALSPNGVHY